MQHDLTLTLGEVTLRPLDPARDAVSLFSQLTKDMWAGMSTTWPTDEAAMVAHEQFFIDAPAAMAFAVEFRGRHVGRTAFYGIEPHMTDIGFTVYNRNVWATVVNPSAKFLLLRHAFEEFRVARVGFRCDPRNERSAAAIKKLGATEEGTLRNFRRTSAGTIGDAQYFSIVDSEWPDVSQQLMNRICNL